VNDAAADELDAAGIADVQRDAPLSALTTLRVGGNARLLVTAERDADLAAAGKIAVEHDLPWLVVGRGSNLLVPDEGWPGIAIVLGRGFRGVEVSGSEASHGGYRVRAGAAEPLPALAVRVADAGCAGFAWACAVPGTVGGAVRMNAGAHGGDMASHLVEVDLVRLRTGARETWVVDALGLGYRRSQLPDDGVVVSATLELAPGDRDRVRSEIDEIRSWRRTHQPLNQPNCGSVFTNPPGDSAGRLVEAAGCKGLTVGGASVSERHANFVVTRPGATAADVVAVIAEVQRRVREHAGIDLHPEVVRVPMVPVRP
jgi:UDP-N-acetylmuramate dehydrogenase